MLRLVMLWLPGLKRARLRAVLVPASAPAVISGEALDSASACCMASTSRIAASRAWACCAWMADCRAASAAWACACLVCCSRAAAWAAAAFLAELAPVMAPTTLPMLNVLYVFTGYLAESLALKIVPVALLADHRKAGDNERGTPLSLGVCFKLGDGVGKVTRLVPDNEFFGEHWGAGPPGLHHIQAHKARPCLP